MKRTPAVKEAMELIEDEFYRFMANKIKISTMIDDFSHTFAIRLKAKLHENGIYFKARNN
jgi:hypothetical protein